MTTEAKRLKQLVALCRELLDETDGMTMGRSVAALLNGIEAVLQQIDAETDDETTMRLSKAGRRDTIPGA